MRKTTWQIEGSALVKSQASLKISGHKGEIAIQTLLYTFSDSNKIPANFSKFTLINLYWVPLHRGPQGHGSTQPRHAHYVQGCLCSVRTARSLPACSTLQWWRERLGNKQVKSFQRVIRSMEIANGLLKPTMAAFVN